MKAFAVALLSSLAPSLVSAYALVDENVAVDTRYPYKGPAVPVGDWVDPTINGNGKGFPRIHEPPAVVPKHKHPKNNINVIALSYIPRGMHIHFQTPFGLGEKPTVVWGTQPHKLKYTATGRSRTQYFHEVQIRKLATSTTYYYKILAANGTTESPVLSFRTARSAGDPSKFSVAVLNDMGYTNAGGTYKQLVKAVEDDVSFAWHGGDISYADDWYSGILPCTSDWPVCYNGTSTELPGGLAIPPEYLVPLPAGEEPNQGGPQGGDMSVLYESNWDLWQQWINKISTKVPYMVLPGNHEASCAEFDGPNNELTAYLNLNKPNSTAPESELTYYSCPPSQRNFTSYVHRFRMPGKESGGVGSFWYSFNYGLAHFVSIDTETDFPYSPEYPFAREKSANETFPTEQETYPTDSGPFGYINGDLTTNKAYEQYNWLAADLAAVDRKATPWIIAMGHRPMYSSQVSGYQKNIRNAFEGLFLEHGVDAYLSGHIHWYERLYPLGANGTIVKSAILDKKTYKAKKGKSIMHIVNGMAGNIESHSTLSPGAPVLNITNVLNYKDYGFSKLTIHSAKKLTWSFIKGSDGSVGDKVTLYK